MNMNLIWFQKRNFTAFQILIWVERMWKQEIGNHLQISLTYDDELSSHRLAVMSELEGSSGPDLCNALILALLLTPTL